MKHLLVAFISLATIIVFQNCSEPLDLSQYDTASQTPQGGTPTPTPPPAVPPPTPPPAPTATTATLTAQSPATTTVAQGANVSFYITASIQPAGAAIVLEWYKNGSLINSGANLFTLNLPNVDQSHVGNYQVLVKDAVDLRLLAQSQIFQLSVTPASVVYSPATLTNSANEVFHLALFEAGALPATAEAFCKVKHGAGATVASAIQNAGTAPASKIVFLSTNCPTNGSSYNLGYGMCAQYWFNTNLITYRIECRP